MLLNKLVVITKYLLEQGFQSWGLRTPRALQTFFKGNLVVGILLFTFHMYHEINKN